MKGEKNTQTPITINACRTEFLQPNDKHQTKKKQKRQKNNEISYKIIKQPVN